MAGEPLTGDLLAGDPLTGNPLTGNPLTCDPLTGDPLAGDPLSGDSVMCDPPTGDLLAGDYLTCDPLTSQTTLSLYNMVHFSNATKFGGGQNVVEVFTSAIAGKMDLTGNISTRSKLGLMKQT